MFNLTDLLAPHSNILLQLVFSDAGVGFAFDALLINHFSRTIGGQQELISATLVCLESLLSKSIQLRMF